MNNTSERIKPLLHALAADPDRNTVILRAYSGRPGCGCGCRGTYSESKARKTAVLNKLLASADDVELGDWSVEPCFSLETENRNLWLYVATGWVEAHEVLVAAAC